jgi:carbon storage regulator
MLVLSRHKHEQIVIGNEEIVITIVEIKGDKVRLGIQADPSIAVHRREIYDNFHSKTPKEHGESA